MRWTISPNFIKTALATSAIGHVLFIKLALEVIR